MKHFKHQGNTEKNIICIYVPTTQISQILMFAIFFSCKTF